ncbi:glycoside hydrolase family 9 protein [Microbulbifer rhizosphaerae]|uniref:glycoside hydrolase family 9 protein n=1 Tax=Microbulbifer rhizosphaerae TaxID=1562603 RepID=UPI00161BDECE|nr:glycoside hydrolase family 9 protein [Microbulbifer rhizosphaerae]
MFRYRFSPTGLNLIAFLVLSFLVGSCGASPKEQGLQTTDQIRLNQVGYHPLQKKVAVVLSEESPGSFRVLDRKENAVVLEGKLSENAAPTWSGKKVWSADFSDLKSEGQYTLEIPGLGKSYTFAVQNGVYKDLGRAGLKAFYFQRASTDIEKAYAGRWAREGGHPDDRVMVHASAASTSRPEGTLISSPKGWYDAGDYNKYIVNSGITMGTLLAAYERYPDYFGSLDLNIPESGDDLPDILNEVLYNLDWMLTMQDPGDGGVYHKLTTAAFEGMEIAPTGATSQRYVVQKSTAATLDFAAVVAQAARVFKPFSPENSAAYLKAAEKAWQWAGLNPQVHYRQNEINRKFDPDVQTGTYGDENLRDEWIWAASELYISTKNPTYWKEVEKGSAKYTLPSWPDVQWLGYYSLIRHGENLEHVPAEWLSGRKATLVAEAKRLRQEGARWSYLAPMGSSEQNFIWGSNSVASNQGILLLEAYHLSGDREFLQSAEDNLDYLLGRNATGYSYVTGFGSSSTQWPHHRLAASRPDLPPLPGFLAGGPNPGQQDGCEYPSDIPDESYTDAVCSYASNEIAINWNAPFAYLANAVNAIRSAN